MIKAFHRLLGSFHSNVAWWLYNKRSSSTIKRLFDWHISKYDYHSNKYLERMIKKK